MTLSDACAVLRFAFRLDRSSGPHGPDRGAGASSSAQRARRTSRMRRPSRIARRSKRSKRSRAKAASDRARAHVRRDVARGGADQAHQGRPGAIGCEIRSSRTTAPLTAKKRSRTRRAAAAAAPRARGGTGARSDDRRRRRRSISAARAARRGYDRGTGIEVMIDGNPARADQSRPWSAPQVVSPTILKPNQRVRMSLPDAAAADPVQRRRRVGVVRDAEVRPALSRRHRVLRRRSRNVERFIDTNKEGVRQRIGSQAICFDQSDDPSSRRSSRADPIRSR